MIGIILLFFVGFLFFAPSARAVTVTTSNIPTSITDQSFTMDVSISGASAGINYLRVDLYKEGTTNYFGETYNESSWYSGSDGKQYFPISIVTGQTWNGSVQARIGNPTTTEYPGSGIYKLKIRRYTSSGNQAMSDTQTFQDITISFTVSSPSPSPSASSSSTSSTISSFSISNTPSQIDSNESFKTSINISSTNNTNTKYYLKGAFRKLGGTNYFGATKVNFIWIGNSKTFTDQFPITSDSSGNWSGNLEVMPDILDSGYDGSGDYLFKVGKYSESGSLDWSNEVNIKIVAQELTMEDNNGGEKVLGEDIEDVDLPEEIYSLEKYRRLASQSANPTPSAQTQIKSEKQVNPFIIIGTVLIIGGILATIIIYAVQKYKR